MWWCPEHRKNQAWCDQTDGCLSSVYQADQALPGHCRPGHLRDQLAATSLLGGVHATALANATPVGVLELGSLATLRAEAQWNDLYGSCPMGSPQPMALSR